ncbi:hypothetical protein V1504DRAFT_471064 [Lipomyces starkeyi]
MDFRPLLDALRLICNFLPDNDDFMVDAADQQCDSRRLTFALLNEGCSSNSISDNLWHEAVFLRSRVSKLLAFLVADGVSSLCEVTSSSGRISPTHGVTWRDAAFEFSRSKELVCVMREWATSIFENLLFPIRRGASIPASMKSSSSSHKPVLSRDSSIRSRVKAQLTSGHAWILARDGPIAPVGRAIDRSAPQGVLDTYSDRVMNLEAAHIMPFKLSEHPPMQTLLSMFGGTNMEAILRGKSINSPSNIFCTDHDTHELFDEFVIGVNYLDGRYWLRKVVTSKAIGAFISHTQDGEEVIFGLGPQLFNIHLAICNVLHASGAGAVINKVLQDEADFNEGIVKDDASASRISAFALKMALKMVQAVDSNESSSDEGVRAATNSRTEDNGDNIFN